MTTPMTRSDAGKLSWFNMTPEQQKAKIRKMVAGRREFMKGDRKVATSATKWAKMSRAEKDAKNARSRELRREKREGKYTPKPRPKSKAMPYKYAGRWPEDFTPLQKQRTYYNINKKGMSFDDAVAFIQQHPVKKGKNVRIAAALSSTGVANGQEQKENDERHVDFAFGYISSWLETFAKGLDLPSRPIAFRVGELLQRTARR